MAAPAYMEGLLEEVTFVKTWDHGGALELLFSLGLLVSSWC